MILDGGKWLSPALNEYTLRLYFFGSPFIRLTYMEAEGFSKSKFMLIIKAHKRLIQFHLLTYRI